MPDLAVSEGWRPDKYKKFKQFLKELIEGGEGIPGIANKQWRKSVSAQFHKLIGEHTGFEVGLDYIEALMENRSSRRPVERFRPKYLAAILDTIEIEREKQKIKPLTTDEKESFWFLAGYPSSFKDVVPSKIYNGVQNVGGIGRVLEDVMNEGEVTFKRLHRSLEKSVGLYIGKNILMWIVQGKYEDTLTLSTSAVIFALLKHYAPVDFMQAEDKKVGVNRAKLFCQYAGYPYEAVLEEAARVEPHIKHIDDDGFKHRRRESPVHELRRETMTLSQLAWEKCCDLLTGLFDREELESADPEIIHGLLVDAKKIKADILPLEQLTALLSGKCNGSYQGYEAAKALGINAAAFARAASAR